MKLLEVCDKRTENIFNGVPRLIYSDNPDWIPHLLQDINKIFNSKTNKLLGKGKAIRYVLLDSKNESIGRIAAFINPKTAKTFDQPTGGVGFFECINNQEAANFLFDSAKDWLKSQGMEAMDGPINLGDKNQFWGLLVHNFEDLNSYGMNYNPPYYQALMENYGFETYYEQYVYSRALRMPVQEVFVRKSKWVLSNHGIRVADCQGRTIEQIAHDFRTVYNASWGGHDNFKEMSTEASLKVAKSLKPIMDPKIIIFAYKDDLPIGFYVNIPELNEIFCHIDGNLNWIGKLKFLYHKYRKTPRNMVGIVFGVAREWHGKGVEGAMIVWFEQNVVPHVKYEKTILTWIGDFNPKMIKVASNLGTKLYRTYHTKRYLFDRNAEFKRCPIVD